MNIEELDLSEFEEMYYAENHTCRVIVWGETTSIICVDMGLWKDVRTVQTESLHPTNDEWKHWKFNEFFKPGSLVGFHVHSSDFGLGVVIEVEPIGSGIKLMIGEEIRTIEYHRVFHLDESKYGNEKAKGV